MDKNERREMDEMDDIGTAVIQLLNCLVSDKSFHSLMDRKLTPKCFWKNTH